MLWDWNSIDSVSRWSTGFFWAGIAFLALLVLAETASHVFGSRKDSLVADRERKTAEAQQQATHDAEQRHAEEVAALQRRAEESEQRVIRLQEQHADRTLTTMQRDTLLRAISPFRGQQVTVVCMTSDGEAINFAQEFMAIFRAAGWNASGVDQAISTGLQPAGIQVSLNEAEVASGKVPSGAGPLIHTVIALGLAKMGFKNPHVPAGTIEFRVGRKPP